MELKCLYIQRPMSHFYKVSQSNSLEALNLSFSGQLIQMIIIEFWSKKAFLNRSLTLHSVYIKAINSSYTHVHLVNERKFNALLLSS